MLRVWASPAVLIDGGWRAKASTYSTGGWISFAPTRLDGKPAGWFLLVGRAPDWTAADADTDLTDPFGGALPTNMKNRNEFVAALGGLTLGDLTGPQQAALHLAFAALQVNTADFTMDTTLLAVFRRLVSATFEKDENFGIGFSL